MARRLSICVLFLFVAFISPFAHLGSSLTIHHGEEWRHLDCSACLTVARVLKKLMDDSLRLGPSTYAVTNRMSEYSTHNRRRQDFRTSEARAVEVLELFCKEDSYYNYPLRLNPKTKVRGYHLRTHGDMRGANCTELRETDVFPPDMNLTELDQMDSNGNLRLARFYTANEIRELSSITSRAAEQFCVKLIENHEESLEEIVKYADNLKELEAQLCGFQWQEAMSSEVKDSPSDSKGIFERISEPLTRVCGDVAALRASAALDQRRWMAWNHRTQNSTATASKEGKTDSNQASSSSISTGSTNITEQSNDNNLFEESEEGDKIPDVYEDL